MIVVASLYRIIPRPVNFAPQIAMALFAGAVIKDKVWALHCRFFPWYCQISCTQVLYVNGLTTIPGFYEGQWQNYILFAAMTCIGFLIKKIRVLNVLIASVAAPTVFFFVSNFVVWSGWQGTRGLNRPKTFEGLLMCYNDALPFYANSVMACCFFSAILFGTYMLVRRKQPQPAPVQEKRMWFE